jgi:hypothetical protein
MCRLSVQWGPLPSSSFLVSRSLSTVSKSAPTLLPELSDLGLDGLVQSALTQHASDDFVTGCCRTIMTTSGELSTGEHELEALEQVVAEMVMSQEIGGVCAVPGVVLCLLCWVAPFAVLHCEA